MGGWRIFVIWYIFGCFSVFVFRPHLTALRDYPGSTLRNYFGKLGTIWDTRDPS